MKDSPTQSHVLQLSHPPIPVVRIGIIGLGNRGLLTLQRYLQIEGIEINALCEIREGNLAKAQQLLKENNRPGATGYTGPEGWKKMCEHDELDIVFICTDWLMHTAMATFAMECNKHVAIEVPAAMSVEECWQLVDTAEKTRRHCIMLENCCYDPFALTTLNMARQGILGTIMHVEGAYIHDLRSMYFAEESEGGYHNHWGKRYSIEHTGNPYPTHGLGPACQILDIHRGDKMEYLVSMSTHQAGMSEYARKKFGKDSPEARQEYKLGDVNTTLIHTAKGKTIMLQYDVCTPRPYSRLQEEGAELPDLIIADGGKGQMGIIHEVLEYLGLDIPVAGLAKNDRHRTSELLCGYPPVLVGIRPTSPLFHFLAHIQEEVHRFAVSFHRQKRSKAFIHSELEQIEGVGDKTVQTLLRHFRTVEKVRAANIEELSALVGAAKAKKIRAFFEK